MALTYSITKVDLPEEGIFKVLEGLKKTHWLTPKGTLIDVESGRQSDYLKKLLCYDLVDVELITNSYQNTDS